MIKNTGRRQVPTGFYLSTGEWFARTNLQNMGASYTEYHDDDINYVQPKGLEDCLHWKFLEEQKHKPPPTFLAVIPGGRVWGRDGAVISPDNKLLWDVSIYFNVTGRAIPESHPIFHMTKLPPVREREETIAVLTSSSSDYYYHWLFDVLPRVHILRNQAMNNYTMIFSFKGLFPFQKETLAVLGISRGQIIACRRHFHLRANKLVVPSMVGYTGHMPRWTAKFLRNQFLPENSLDKLPGYERIYISRRNARFRHVLNEENVMAVLSKYGFKVVFLELMPFAEQVRLFLSAEVIVSAHGGGFANLVFCDPGTKVLECFSPNYISMHYWILSNHVNLDYYYLVGEGERPADHMDPLLVWDHITINFEQLESMIKLMGL